MKKTTILLMLLALLPVSAFAQTKYFITGSAVPDGEQPLVAFPDGKYKYAGTAPYYAGKGSDIKIIGGKTGYEDIPTNCFVTAGQDDVTGRKYVCVQVGRVDKTQASVNSSASTYDTREMYWKYAKEDR